MSNDEKWDEFTSSELGKWRAQAVDKSGPWARAECSPVRGLMATVSVFAGTGSVIANLFPTVADRPALTVHADSPAQAIAALEMFGGFLGDSLPDGAVQWAIDRVSATKQVVEWVEAQHTEEVAA